MSCVLIVGDSIIKSFNTEKFNEEFKDKDGEVFVFSYPGINAEKLAITLSEEKLPPSDKIGLVFVHVGTNDASRERDDKPVHIIAEKIGHILNFMGTKYSAARIMCSAILPRFDIGLQTILIPQWGTENSK